MEGTDDDLEELIIKPAKTDGKFPELHLHILSDGTDLAWVELTPQIKSPEAYDSLLAALGRVLA